MVYLDTQRQTGQYVIIATVTAAVVVLLHVKVIVRSYAPPFHLSNSHIRKKQETANREGCCLIPISYQNILRHKFLEVNT